MRLAAAATNLQFARAWTGRKATLDSALGRAVSRRPDVCMATRRLPNEHEATVGMVGAAGNAAALPNAGKQAGLYTDLDPDSGSWTVPGDVLSSECRVDRAEEPPRK